jgi:hypothetical protein
MENVKPAGAKRLGYAFDMAPVERLFNGRLLAKKFTKTIRIYADAAKIFTKIFFIVNKTPLYHYLPYQIKKISNSLPHASCHTKLSSAKMSSSRFFSRIF